MKFDELDKRMRLFETAHDYCVLPEMYIVARLDGRCFTALTKEKHSFEAPFDECFRDYMVETTKHLFECGFRILYGYTESDEISILFHKDENTFGRKSRKINSVLAGEASAKLSLLLGSVACFDSRVSELPAQSLVVDYFRWRNEDAHRNALNAHCYWALRRDGKSAAAATKELSGMSAASKNELLFKYGINFNEIPNWQKRGIGVYWSDYEKQGINPTTMENTMAIRRKLHVNYDLPMKDEYNDFLNGFFNEKL